MDVAALQYCRKPHPIFNIQNMSLKASSPHTVLCRGYQGARECDKYIAVLIYRTHEVCIVKNFANISKSAGL